jgi:hypothetical protein
VLPSRFEYGQFPPGLADRADAGEREIEPARKDVDPLGSFGWRREQQLVVVAPSRGAFQVPSFSTKRRRWPALFSDSPRGRPADPPHLKRREDRRA